MSIIKRIAAAFVSVALTASMFMSVGASAKSYEYGVAKSTTKTGLIKSAAAIEQIHPVWAGTRNIYVNRKGKKYSSFDFYDADLDTFRSKGELNINKVKYDKALKNIDIGSGYLSPDNTAFLRDYSTGKAYTVKYSAKKNTLSVTKEISDVYWTGLDAVYKYKSAEGYTFNVTWDITSSSGRGTLKVTVISPDRKKTTKSFSGYISDFSFGYNCIYYSEMKIQNSRDNIHQTDTVIKIDYKLNTSRLLEHINTYNMKGSNAGYLAPSPRIVLSEDGIYYLTYAKGSKVNKFYKTGTSNGDELLYFSESGNDIYVYNINRYSSNGYEIFCETANYNYDWVRIDEPKAKKMILFNVKNKNIIDVSKYYEYADNIRMIDADTCYIPCYDNPVIDLAKGELTSGRYLGNGVIAQGTDYYDKNGKALPYNKMTEFDSNNIALVIKKNKAFFVDQNFKQVSESFAAKSVGNIGELFYYNDGKTDYFVTYTKKSGSKS